MTNKITDKTIIELNRRMKNFSIQHIKSCFPNEYNYVLNRFNDSDSFKESWCRIIFNVIKRPVCKICCKKVNFIGYRTSDKEHLFSIGCCNKHRQMCPEVIAKAKNTFINNYGVSNPNKCKEVRDKIKRTCLEKYGVDHNWKSEESKEKSRQTCLKKYGVEYSFQSKNNKEKSKQTWLKKYGVDHPLKSRLVQQSFDHKSQVENMINTKYINHTHNTSKPENKLYEYLSSICKVLRNWNKDKRYPYMVDFYLPDFDLFIECNFHWTHGGHPYNENSKEDKQKLDQWKSKHTKYYDNAINTWTKRDIKKRNQAKKNNLFYVELWNYEEGMKLFEEISNL